MPARFIALPFAADAFGPCALDDAGRPARIVVSNGQVSTEIDLATGASEAVSGTHRRKRGDPALTLGGVRDRLIETSEGPRIELFTLGPSDTTLLRTNGELTDAARSGALVLLLLGMPGPRYDVVASTLGLDAPQIRLPGVFWAELAAEGPYAIAATQRMLHLFRLDGASIGGISVGLPEASRLDARLIGGEALVVIGKTLLLVPLGEVPFTTGAHHPIAVSYAQLVGRAHGLARPGVVVALVGNKILVDHPDAKRLTIERAPQDPPVKVGDALQIDDAREPLPGIVKVHAWTRVEDGKSSARPPTAVLSFPPPDLALAPDGAPRAPRAKSADAMRALAQTWGFTPPPALMAFLDATDADPALRRWARLLGVEYVEVGSLTPSWSADPCLVAFAGRGNGDEWALYLYPPALAAGEEPVVVEYLHETNECELVARSFSHYLELWLRQHTTARPDIVAMLRERLAIVATDAPVAAAEAPSWLPPLRSSSPSIESLRALEAAGDLVAAERGWALRFTRGEHATAMPELRRIYGALGWRGPLAALSS